MRRLEDSIKTDRIEPEWDGVYRIRPGHYREWEAISLEHGSDANLLAEFCCENETTCA